MNLDKSMWKGWLPEKFILSTDRKYYNKYYFRAELSIPGATFMWYIKGKSFTEFNNYVKEQKARASQNKYSYYRQDTIAANARGLYDIHHACLKQKGKSKIQTRIEGKKLRIFASTAEELLEIFNNCPTVVKSCLVNIAQPASVEAANKLDNNVVYTKSAPKHNYKVTVREGKYDFAVKQQIANYCDNFPDSIHLSKCFRAMLDNNRQWISGYFHTDSLEPLTFLKLISPRFVNKIYKLEQAI